MPDKAQFQTAIAEISEVATNDYKHPYLTIAKFIFADDRGAATSTSQNGIPQGIEFEDFDEVIKSAIDTPVKMKFLGADVGNHTGAYVIGHIKAMEKAQAENGANQLIATAVLYSDEYPNEIGFLKEAHASGKAPGISYEIGYGDSLVKNGIQWLKKMVTGAATFVRSPAYGTRTSLLALASAQNDDEFLATMKTLVAHAEEKTGQGKPETKGGNQNVDELETAKAELTKFKAEAETKTSEIAKLTESITAKDSEISGLTEKITKLERARTLETRTRMFSDAGITLEADAEKRAKKEQFWLSLSDEAFGEYIDDLKTAKASSKPAEKPADRAAASSGVQLPRPTDTSASENRVSFNFR